jgi:hypothetical protein
MDGAQWNVTFSTGLTLRDIATPDVSNPTVFATMAEALHRTVLQRAAKHSDYYDKQPPMPTFHEGNSGYNWRGSINRVIEEMWPELTGLGSSEIKTELNRALNRAGDLICTQRNPAPTPSVWFVRGAYTPVGALMPKHEPLVPAAKVKVTPAEAGEDREPAPVESGGYVCGWPTANGPCQHRTNTSKWRTRHIFAEHRTAEDWVKAVLRAAEGPLTQQEIYERALASDPPFPGHTQTVARVLQAWHANRTVLSSQVNNNSRGGRAWTYWLPPAEEESTAALVTSPYIETDREPGPALQFGLPVVADLDDDTVLAYLTERLTQPTVDGVDVAELESKVAKLEVENFALKAENTRLTGTLRKLRLALGEV